MNYYGFNVLQEGIPIVTNDQMNAMFRPSILQNDNRVAVWIDDPQSATQADINDFYDSRRVLQNPNLRWNNMTPNDVQTEAQKEALRKMYGLNVSAGGQARPRESENFMNRYIPFMQDNTYYPTNIKDPYLHGKQFEPAENGQLTGGAAPITQQDINAAYNRTVKNTNLATNGKRLRDIYNKKMLESYGEIGATGGFDPELIKRMIQSGMFDR